MAKLFYYDLETTGLDYTRNGIHQISGMIEIDGVVKAEFNHNVMIFPNDQIDPKALEISGITKDDIAGYDSPNIVYSHLINLIGIYINKFDKKDKFHLIGYNNRGFDDNFLRLFFAKSMDRYFGSYFWSDSIDVMILASNHLREERSLLADFKLSTVARYLGIQVDDDRLHDALYDIVLTKAIYNKVCPS